MNTQPAQSPQGEHPWLKARRLGRELSETLAECNGGRWVAHIMPGGQQYAVGFAAIEEGEHPAQTVERLSAALAVALNGYRGGRFHVRVYPEHEGGYGFYFASTAAPDREGM
jgi:hypothetical protein